MTNQIILVQILGWLRICSMKTLSIQCYIQTKRQAQNTDTESTNSMSCKQSTQHTSNLQGLSPQLKLYHRFNM